MFHYGNIFGKIGWRKLFLFGRPKLLSWHFLFRRRSRSRSSRCNCRGVFVFVLFLFLFCFLWVGWFCEFLCRLCWSAISYSWCVELLPLKIGCNLKAGGFGVVKNKLGGTARLGIFANGFYVTWSVSVQNSFALFKDWSSKYFLWNFLGRSGTVIVKSFFFVAHGYENGFQCCLLVDDFGPWHVGLYGRSSKWLTSSKRWSPIS